MLWVRCVCLDGTCLGCLIIRELPVIVLYTVCMILDIVGDLVVELVYLILFV